MVLGITRDDLLDIMEIRSAVEPLAVRYAASAATQQDLQELEHLVQLQEFYCEKGDAGHLSQTDGQFHSLICRACGHGVIRDTLLPLYRKTARFRRSALEGTPYDRHMVEEHREILLAIAHRDPETAAERTRSHLEQARKRMTERVG